MSNPARRLMPLIPCIVLGFPATAHAARHSMDVISVLIREHSREGTSAEYLESGTDGTYARYVLNRPGFPYADVVQSALPEPDAPTRRAIRAISTPEYVVNHRELHDMKVRDLGFTKARPRRDIPESRIPVELRRIPGVSSAVKAGVEPDIYVQATEFAGAENPAIAANYAVAAQLLREKLSSTPRGLWAERGLRHDILDRFVHAGRASSLLDHDLYYLIQLLDGAMATWEAGRLNAYGMRELPLPFRVSRMAAAYRDRRPFEKPPCLENGRFDPDSAGMGGVDRRPLCFQDATDRAVHEWYVSQLRHEMSSARPVPRTAMSVAERMTVPLKSSRQGWIGIRRAGAIDIAYRKEVAEAKIAELLLVEGELSYREAFDLSQRAMRLTCNRQEL